MPVPERIIYQALFYPIRGGPPKCFWVLDENVMGWTVEEPEDQFGPGKRRPLLRSQWTRDENEQERANEEEPFDVSQDDIF